MAWDESLGRVTVAAVVDGSAAAAAGMEPRDVLVSANGIAFGSPREVLDGLLDAETPIKFVIERAGREQTLTVTPQKRK
jgi:S1-C subfamily serine protease